MADTVHTLEIRTTLKDGISGPLRKAGEDARAVGQKAAQGMVQAEQAANRVGQAFEKNLARGVKSGLGSLAIGISSAASASQGLEKNIISIGSNIVTGFMTGGPAVAAIAALGTGLGMIAGKAQEAAESVDRLRVALERANATRMQEIEARWVDIEDLDTAIEATKTGKDAGTLKTKKSLEKERRYAQSDYDVADEDIKRLEKYLQNAKPRNLGTRIWEGSVFGGGRDWGDDDSTHTQKQRLELEDARKRKHQAGVRLRDIDEQRGKVDTLEAEKKAADERKQAADDAKKAEEDATRTAEQRKKVAEDINKEIQDQVDLLRAADEREKLLVEQAHERRDVEAKGGDLKALAVKHAEQLKDLEQKQNEEATKAAEKQAEKARAKAESIAEANEQLQFDLDMTTASSEIERLRVQQARELAQARREGLDVATLEKRHSEEMKQAIDREKQALEDKRKVQQDYIQSLREEAMVAGSKDEKERSALEEKIRRVHALEEAYKKAGTAGVQAQMDVFKAQDKQKADADRAAKSDPLKGWNADMGMGPLAYLRQQKKQERQRKKWERTAANLRAEARDRMGFTVGEDGGGWGAQPGAGDMDYQGKGSGDSSADDPPAPANDQSGANPAGAVADSAKSTADAAKAQAESLGKAAEAAQSMATEATAAKDAAITSATAAEGAKTSLEGAAKSLDDMGGKMDSMAASAANIASSATTIVNKVQKLEEKIKAIEAQLKL